MDKPREGWLPEERWTARASVSSKCIMRLTTRIIHGQPETSRILLTSLLRRAGAVERRLGERGEEVHAEPDERYGGVGCGCVGVGGRGSHAKRWGRGQSSARAALCMKSDRRLAHLNDILAFAPLNAAGLSRCRAPAQWPHGCLSATSYALALAPRACPWHPHQTQRLDTGHRTAGPRGATRARARGSDLVKHADARPRAGLHTMRHLEPRCQTPGLHLGAGAA